MGLSPRGRGMVSFLFFDARANRCHVERPSARSADLQLWERNFGEVQFVSAVAVVERDNGSGAIVFGERGECPLQREALVGINDFVRGQTNLKQRDKPRNED